MTERGSDEALALWQAADRVVSSSLLYPEARSALERAARAERLAGRRLDSARALVERLWRDLDRIGLTEELARRAGELAETRALRAYEAVHLASASSVADADLVLVAGDGELITAANALGLPTARLA